MQVEFFQGRPAGTHTFGATDLNYPVVNESNENTQRRAGFKDPVGVHFKSD